ncbi:hypothetical protein O3M35_000504 [Rhynocoris fuscipes]|uniref:DUF5641 domain-containing protein n=1 Tax=Rhynocoris fuscipes TaxID=488301 RepID=A0AAW1DS15_9HEMI
MQRRCKWTKKDVNLKPGDLVVVGDPLSFPRQWPLGHITKVFPSPDGVVRRAKVRTQSGTYIRPIFKLYRLPLNY